MKANKEVLSIKLDKGIGSRTMYGAIVTGVSKMYSTTIYNVLRYGFVEKANGETDRWSYDLKQLDESTLIKFINSGELSGISNVGVRHKANGTDELYGTTGDLKRFTGNKIHKPMVILSEIRVAGDDRVLGYRVATSNGKVAKVKANELIYSAFTVAKSGDIPFQNAQLVDGKYIRGYVDMQFILEVYHIRKSTNIAPANVNIKENAANAKKMEALFNAEQIRELKLGREHGIAYRVYADRELSAKQMMQCRKALEEKVDARLFAKPAFSAQAMLAYRTFAKYGTDIKAFINPAFDMQQLMSLNAAWIAGINLDKLADPNIDATEMEKIRIEEESKLWDDAEINDRYEASAETLYATHSSDELNEIIGSHKK